MKQVWFPGTHSDVGGGYPELESGLSKITLQWMLREAKACHLLCDPERVATMLGERGCEYAKPDPKARFHESLQGLLWKVLEHIPKPRYDDETKKSSWERGLSRRRHWPKPGEDFFVHVSARERGAEYMRRLDLPSHATETD
jgi:hypothetical protein